MLRRIHQVPERIARRHGLERFRVCDIRSTPEQHRIAILHQLEEALADVVVPVRQRPATVLEPAITVLVLAARRLHHAVQGHELRNHELSHSDLLVLQYHDERAGSKSTMLSRGPPSSRGPAGWQRRRSTTTRCAAGKRAERFSAASSFCAIRGVPNQQWRCMPRWLSVESPLVAAGAAGRRELSRRAESAQPAGRRTADHDDPVYI